MSSLTTRLRSCWKTLKTPILLGTWFTGSALSWLWIKNKKNQDKPDINMGLAQTGTQIYNLDELVREKAWTMYRMHPHKTKSFLGRQLEPALQLDWSGVQMIACKTTFNESTTSPVENANRIIFETVFQNTSDKEQQHNLKTEVQTSAVCETSLTEGYTRDYEVALSLPAPEAVAKSTFFFSEGISVKKAYKNVEKSKLVWVIEDFVKVPSKSKLTVSKEVEEKQIEYDFKTAMGFSGNIKVTFKDQNQQIMVTYPIPMKTIIVENIPIGMRDTKDDFDCKDDFDYIKIQGKCKFKYDNRQEITTKSEKLLPFSLKFTNCVPFYAFCHEQDV